MSLRDGLANLRAAREEVPGPQKPASPPPAQTPQPAPEKRETCSTRLRPSVRYALKRHLLEAQEQGQKVKMEAVLETLIYRYVQDAEFRAEINRQARRNTSD
ncbi:hypothetical protein E7T06_20880 [Deinococcus sp. Arct2-2]|uniref:hypothetical protein n=1 Tax=Deinococcus sp. Arct2-2 TaxID=2568653 RepID=UPI0010A33434|nr:hypothetical protein [Deinococcus sp. Arct2-2]THF66693.1 hypothetical protein E7T06_20880 [Deinococcus sp. Arct2-2]